MRWVLAAALSLGSVLAVTPALAQGYPPGPPPGYMAAPPPDWAHHEDWMRRKEADREAFWHEYREASWRCDHGDRDACHWLHEHAPG